MTQPKSSVVRNISRAHSKGSRRAGNKERVSRKKNKKRTRGRPGQDVRAQQPPPSNAGTLEHGRLPKDANETTRSRVLNDLTITQTLSAVPVPAVFRHSGFEDMSSLMNFLNNYTRHHYTSCQDVTVSVDPFDDMLVHFPVRDSGVDYTVTHPRASVATLRRNLSPRLINVDDEIAGKFREFAHLNPDFPISIPDDDDKMSYAWWVAQAVHYGLPVHLHKCKIKMEFYNVFVKHCGIEVPEKMERLRMWLIQQRRMGHRGQFPVNIFDQDSSEDEEAVRESSGSDDAGAKRNP